MLSFTNVRMLLSVLHTAFSVLCVRSVFVYGLSLCESFFFCVRFCVGWCASSLCLCFPFPENVAYAEPCREGVEGSECPEHQVFVADIGKGGPHSIDADVGVCAVGGREEHGKPVPEFGECRSRPADSGEEEQGDGGEDDEAE